LPDGGVAEGERNPTEVFMRKGLTLIARLVTVFDACDTGAALASFPSASV
jgi:hypothetical protein